MKNPTMKDCLKALANASPDGVAEQNGVGFNAADLEWGCKMANTPYPESTWSPRQKFYVYKLLRKYARQLLAYGIDFTEVPQPPDIEEPKATNLQNPAVAAAVNKVLVHRTVKKGDKQDEFALLFPYDAMLVQQVKGLPYRNRKWNPEAKRWDIVLDREHIDGKAIVDFQNLLITAQFHVPTEVNEAIHELLALAIGEEAKRDLAFKKSFQTDAVIDIPGLGGELRGFQKAGVAYAIEKKRTFIADDMGLGKTVQAIAVVEHQKAFPAIFVVPASLRLNWLKELRKWLPHRNATQEPQDMKYAMMHILVLSYEGLVKHYSFLEEIDWKAITLDESQKIKNNKAQRTVAAKDLAKVSKAPIRLCLTGTPIDIAPYEYAPQLTFLDRMNDMGGSKHFYEYYCQSDRHGAANLAELNANLRRICFIRRMKKDVLTELPDKARDFVPLELDNWAEYRRAEADVVSWLKSDVVANPEDYEVTDDQLFEDDSVEAKQADVVARAERAPHLVRINILKRLALMGMLEDAKKWIEEFIESGEKLVVWCHHIEAQRQVHTLFKDVAVWTRASTGPQYAVDQFQTNPKVKIIVCSLKADHAGHTLTAASNSCFLERGWTSTLHDQAEDREHRIGQKNAVMCYYIYPRGTIYEKIDALLEERRELVRVATDGGEAIAKKSILRDLIGRMAGEGVAV